MRAEGFLDLTRVDKSVRSTSGKLVVTRHDETEEHVGGWINREFADGKGLCIIDGLHTIGSGPIRGTAYTNAVTRIIDAIESLDWLPVVGERISIPGTNVCIGHFVPRKAEDPCFIVYLG